MVVSKRILARNEEYMAKPNNKKSQILVMDKKYQGKYVAFNSLRRNRTIVATGKNAGRVVAAARRKGISEPVIVFVPYQDVAYLY